MTVDTDEFLAHFGVKGMHWGIRRDRPIGSPRSSSGKKSALAGVSVRELQQRALNQSSRLEVRAGRPMTNAEQQHGLTRNQKILIGVGVGAAAVGLAFAASYGMKKIPAFGNVGGGLFNKLRPTEDAGKAQFIQGIKDRVSTFAKSYEKRAVEFETKPMTLAKFDALSEKDLTVPSGTVFKRLATDQNESMARRLFVSFTDADNDRYQAVYADSIVHRTGQTVLHVNAMTAGKDIKSPSAKKRVEMLMAIVDENKTYTDANGVSRTARNIMQHLIDPSATPGVDTSESSEALAIRGYNMFARNLVADHPINNAYFDKVKRAGYNALVDDNDAGQLADLPMILLSADKDIASRTSTEYTKALRTQAAVRLQQLAEEAAAKPAASTWDPFGDEL